MKKKRKNGTQPKKKKGQTKGNPNNGPKFIKTGGVAPTS
jgi:hypothetical protein